MASNDKSTLLFLSEDSIKTLIDALITAYDVADCHARSADAELTKRREEVEELTTKLQTAEARIITMEAAYNDLDDERDAWKTKYDKLVADSGKKFEREGK